VSIGTTIRVATDGDIELLLHWSQALHAVERAFESQLTYSEEQAREHYLRELQNAQALFLIAEHEAQLAGYLYGYISDGPDYFRTKSKHCVIEVVYLEPDARGKGIAEELVRRCMEWAQAAQASRFVAGIYAMNIDSIKLFQKMGFEPYHLAMVTHLKRDKSE
jgi:RimJ/RimL family protein N-acetyltransferase